MNDLTLSPKFNSFGFNLMEFNTLLEGGTFFGYTYNGKWVGNLITKNESLDQIYDYEDEHVYLYSPSERSWYSTFFFELKKKYLICENEKYFFYTNFAFTDEEACHYVMVEQLSKSDGESKLYHIMTHKYNIQWSTRIMADKNMQFLELDVESLHSTFNFSGLNIYLFINFNIATLRELLLKLE
nr:hypothetical protein [uncultured Flavobacterium sp.]